MSELEKYKEDFVLLVEAGFVAVTYMDEDAAVKLFTAAQTLDGSSTAPQLGLAAVHLHKLETKKSNKILEKVLEKEPENHRAEALLGISYLLSNTNIEKGEKLLHNAMTNSDDPATRRLGELWLEVLEKAIHKSDSPIQPQKPKKKEEASAS